MRQRAAASAIVTLLVASGVYAFGGRILDGTEDASPMPTGSGSTVTMPEPTTTSGLPANSQYVDASEEELPATTERPTTTSGKPGSGSTGSTAITAKPTTTQAPSTSGTTQTTNPPVTTGSGPSSTSGAVTFPTTIPVSIDGANVTRYIPSNDVQASLLGLAQGDVRSWTLQFTASGDTTADHRRIRDAIAAAGGSVRSDDLQYFLGSGSGQIVGSWQEFGFILTVLNWKDITFSLVNW